MSQGTFVSGATTVTFTEVHSPDDLPALVTVSRKQNVSGLAGSLSIGLGSVGNTFDVDATVLGTWADGATSALQTLEGLRQTVGTLTIHGRASANCELDAVSPPDSTKSGANVVAQRLTMTFTRLT